MSKARRFVGGLGALVRSRQVEEDLDHELQAFLEASVEEKMRAGLSRDAAMRAARLEIGSIPAVKDRTRDAGWETAIENVWRDARFALRTLRRSPGFTFVAVLTLALGIGANTALFQLADAVRLRPLPVNKPDQLVEVRTADPSRGRMGTFSGRRPVLTNVLWEHLRDRQQAFSGLAVWGAFPVNVSPSGDAQLVQGLWVNGGFFDTLGLRPALGRLLAASDDQRGCGQPVAVLGHAFWQRQFGGAAAVVGRTLTLDGHPFEIVGVAPAGFDGLEVGRSFDVAAPICAERIVNTEQSALDNRAWWWLTALARLQPGWSVDRASTHLAAISPSIFQDTVPDNLRADVADSYRASTLKAFSAPTGVSGTVREEYETPLSALLALASVVLIIASANIATLLIARATARERDIAVRLALGASRGRLIRQFMTESAILALVGAAFGVLLAQVLSDGLVGLLRTGGFQFFAVTFDLHTNWRVLLFAIGITLATCLLFGLLPAILTTRSSNWSLAGAMTRTSASARPKTAVRSVLVVAQVALALVLVVTALLFSRTLRNLVMADIGFDPDGVAVLVADLQRARIPVETRIEVEGRLLDAIRAIPGVTGASSVRMVPLTGESWTNNVMVGGVQRQKQAYFNRVSAGFFQTMRTRVIAGRDFTSEDVPASRRVAIVNESFAREMLGTSQPIGATFQILTARGGTPPAFEVVGLVADSKYTSLRDPFEPIAFFPATQELRPQQYVNLVVRMATASASLRPVTEAITRVEPRAVIIGVTMQSQVENLLVRERLMAMLSGSFGGAAALLALLGLYGVVAYAVTQRTREIGIRTALGADRAQVVSLVLRQCTRLAVAGVVLGLIVAAAVTRYLDGLLYGLSSLDPATFVAVPIAFLVVALLAAYLPARRAAKVDPLIALRCE